MNRLLIFFVMIATSLSACVSPAVNVSETMPPVTELPADHKTIEAPQKYRQLIKFLEPFFEPMGTPKPDEWLASFREDGQTFEQYINGDPTLPTAERKILYVRPLGTFNPVQRKVVIAAAEYLEAFFGLPVKLLPEKNFDKPLRLADRRLNSQTHQEQIKTGYILDDLLAANLPADAAALIAFTNEDLYPGKDFNFVFGEASLENRVGVWSLARISGDGNFKLFLERTIKIAAHETGHMFSIHHCTKYICEMSGVNHLGEMDAHPVDVCPACAAKIYRLAGIEPRQRYLKLAEFCRKYGLRQEFNEFMSKAKAVKNLNQ